MPSSLFMLTKERGYSGLGDDNEEESAPETKIVTLSKRQETMYELGLSDRNVEFRFPCLFCL